MSGDAFASGDVFWAPDPYTEGSDPRPWLVLAAEAIPYAGEEYICAGLTLSDLPDNVEVRNEDWIAGNGPRRHTVLRGCWRRSNTMQWLVHRDTSRKPSPKRTSDKASPTSPETWTSSPDILPWLQPWISPTGS